MKASKKFDATSMAQNSCKNAKFSPHVQEENTARVDTVGGKEIGKQIVFLFFIPCVVWYYIMEEEEVSFLIFGIGGKAIRKENIFIGNIIIFTQC